MSNKSNQNLKGSASWNDLMFSKHPTPYTGIAGFIEKRRVQAIINVIRTKANHQGFSLLEIGCEAGNLLNAINQVFPQAKLTGFDISADALKLAKAKFSPSSVTFLQGDITDPKSLSTSYDIIVCSETLEHIPNYQAAIENMAQLGSDKTLFIFTVPLESLKNRVKNLLNKLGLFDLFFRGIEKGMSEWHVNDFSKQGFLGLLSEHFEVKAYQQIMGLHQIAVAIALVAEEKKDRFDKPVL